MALRLLNLAPEIRILKRADNVNHFLKNAKHWVALHEPESQAALVPNEAMRSTELQKKNKGPFWELASPQRLPEA